MNTATLSKLNAQDVCDDGRQAILREVATRADNWSRAEAAHQRGDNHFPKKVVDDFLADYQSIQAALDWWKSKESELKAALGG